MTAKMAAYVLVAIVDLLCSLQQPPQMNGDVRLNVIVSADGNLRNDGKGIYSTGKDGVAAWLNPTRWSEISFDICMNWPFARFPGVNSATSPAPTGTPGRRTLIHRFTDPVPEQRGKPIGVFTGPGGSNDVALPKPLTPTVSSFTEMVIGSSLSPQSAEVRFCNADCTRYYSLIFGEKSVFGYANVNGNGTTRPTVSRTSETTWRIDFPSRTIGRLWDRSGNVTDLGLYYYEGSLELRKQ